LKRRGSRGSLRSSSQKWKDKRLREERGGNLNRAGLLRAHSTLENSEAVKSHTEWGGEKGKCEKEDWKKGTVFSRVETEY